MSRRNPKKEPVTVVQYTKGGKKGIVSLDSPEAGRSFINKVAKKHKNTPGVSMRATPNGASIVDKNGKEIAHYQIEKD